MSTRVLRFLLINYMIIYTIMDTAIVNTILVTDGVPKKFSIEKSLEYNDINLLSYRDMTSRKIYISNKLNRGSYNTIYNISASLETSHCGTDIILRISDKKVLPENIKMELRGIRKQFKLSRKNSNIGFVVDYGRLVSNKDDSHQEYSILQKYGVSLKETLEHRNAYKSIMVPLKFIKNFLEAVDVIHKSGYAHLDLKPSNILLKKVLKKCDIISDLDFALIDFGAVRKFKTDKSKFIKAQMASAAFSPPELTKRCYGKKSDIWAFGVIAFLVIQNRFFFKAGGEKLFVNTNPEVISTNITRELTKLRRIIVPSKFKKTTDIETYLGIMSSNSNMDILTDFFMQLFTIDSSKRPNTDKLLKHELFNLI